MLWLYLMLFTFKVVATVMCAGYCYRTSRLKLTPTFTYMAFFIAFTLRVVTQIRGAFYTKEILAFWGGFGVGRILSSQILEAVIIACFLIGFARTYYGLARLLRMPTASDA